MSKKQGESSGFAKNHGSAYWLLLFLSLAVFIFLFRGFLFNEYGGVTNPLVGAIIPFLFLMLLLSSVIMSLLAFHMISLEKSNNIASGMYEMRGNMINIRSLVMTCSKSDGFIFLSYINSFIIFIGAFLSDLLRRSTDEAMVGVYILFFLLALSIPIIILIFVGMLIATRGLKKSLFVKSLFLLLVIITAILIFYACFRTLWINFYL